MSDLWYYADQNGPVGPLTLQELKQTLASVPNPLEVLVWRKTFQDWKRAGDVPELTAQFVVPSPSRIRHFAPEIPHKTPSTHGSKWWWLMVALPYLGSAGSRVGREEMGRLSAERRIGKEVARWFSEDPPAVIVNAVRLFKANYLAVLVVVICVAYGVYDGLLLNSLFSGLIAGILSAGILILLGLAARKYRVKKPTQLMIWIGNILYGLGCALGFYGVVLIFYQIAHVGLVGGMKALGSLLPSIIFYPALGWGIRYMLGR